VAQALSFYETVNANGVMRMIAQPDGFTVPAGESLVLEPGEKHLMLENLRATSLGDTIHPYPHLLHWENKKRIIQNDSIVRISKPAEETSLANVPNASPKGKRDLVSIVHQEREQ